MRWLLFTALLHSVLGLGQQSQPAPSETLPESPYTAKTYRQTVSVTTPEPCKTSEQGKNSKPCPPEPDRNPYQRFLNSPASLPLTARQKGLLAIRDVVDPANLFTIVANAGFTVGIDPHTGYRPGLKGFGRDVGYSLAQDATGEFVSTFALDSILREDPHYHRSPQASVPRRFLHAVSHTVISQHDDGRPMVNYSTLLTYPISAEFANLYVPGVHGNGASTATRVVTGFASDPIDNLITEFLPDVAKRFHIRIVFVQQILNNIAAERPAQ